MAATISTIGWIAEAIGISYEQNTYGPFASGQPKWIVLHGTASGPGSTAQGIATNWHDKPVSSTSVSTHVLINKDGSYVQGLSLDNIAWGNSGAANSGRASYLPSGNLNSCTLSIEHIKYDQALNSDEITPLQRASSFDVVKAMCAYHGIPRRVVTISDVSGGGIIRHQDCDQLNRWNCPGPYPFADLQNFLNGGPAMFSNDLCVHVWLSTGLGLSRLTGIFSEWQTQWKAGHYKGAPSTKEYPITLPDGKAGVAQNFGSETCTWQNDTGTVTWL